MSAPEKKKLGIALGSKVFGFKSFQDELKLAHAGELSPSVMDPADLEAEGLVAKGAPSATAMELLAKEPDSIITDPSMLPHEVQEMVEANTGIQVGAEYGGALTPGMVAKVTGKQGQPMLLTGVLDEDGAPGY